MSSKSSSADVPSEPITDKVDNISSDKDGSSNNNNGGNEEEQEFGVQGGEQWNTEGPFVNKPNDNENNESGTGDGSNV